MDIHKLFDIPLYRLSPAAFKLECEKEKKLFIGASPNVGLETYYEREIAYGWKFNEIIGYISLEIWLPNKIKGQLYLKETKKIVKNSRAKIKYVTGARLEIPIRKRSSVEELKQEIILSLNEFIKSRRRLRNRYFDTSQIETLVPVINRDKLLSL